MYTSKTNIRQVERLEQLKTMLGLALAYVEGHRKNFEAHPEEYPKENEYKLPFSFWDIPTDKEHFLADFRDKSGAGNFASERYFADFITLGWFEYRLSKDKKQFWVSDDYEIHAHIRSRHGVSFPDTPKPQPSEPERTAKTGKIRKT